MGQTHTSQVTAKQRDATARAFTATTVKRLKAAQESQADGTPASAASSGMALIATNSPQASPAIPSLMLSKAMTYATRGSNPFVKEELIHLVVILQIVHNATSVAPMVYEQLSARGVDELYALLRLLMYNPQVMEHVTSVLKSKLRTAS